MSTIAILRELMEKLADKRGVEVIHPWQEFDMIGGTSTVRQRHPLTLTPVLIHLGWSLGNNAWPSPNERRPV